MTNVKKLSCTNIQTYFLLNMRMGSLICSNLLNKRKSQRKKALKSKCCHPEWLFDAFWRPGQTSRDRLSGQESCQETNVVIFLFYSICWCILATWSTLQGQIVWLSKNRPLERSQIVWPRDQYFSLLSKIYEVFWKDWIWDKLCHCFSFILQKTFTQCTSLAISFSSKHLLSNMS